MKNKAILLAVFTTLSFVYSDDYQSNQEPKKDRSAEILGYTLVGGAFGALWYVTAVDAQICTEDGEEVECSDAGSFEDYVVGGAALGFLYGLVFANGFGDKHLLNFDHTGKSTFGFPNVKYKLQTKTYTIPLVQINL